MTTKSARDDVVILGGGLAGLCLARQLKMASPDLAISVVEKNRFPVPEAIAKVGESTVEIGSHYLADTLDLAEHIGDKHLRKFGIRCFFGEAQPDLAQNDELGVSEVFAVPTFQLDRGVLENHLHRDAVSMGVRVLDGAAVEDIDLGESQKSIRVRGDSGELQLNSRWLVDAAGRQGLLKRKMNLEASTGHVGSAVWFRVDRHIEVDDWSGRSEWHDKCRPRGQRWLSTNHLMGAGYWLWIIPLASGVTSVGIVMDEQAWREAQLDSRESTLRWLGRHQPRLAAAIEGATWLDFARAENFSYACRQAFSEQGWGISGEAGYFADPFYSPGTDFIAIANTFMTNMIVKQSAGESVHVDSVIYQKLFNSFFESTLSIYQGIYGGFGDRKLMGLKMPWDYAYYWGVLSLLFFQQTVGDIQYFRRMASELMSVQDANFKMQALFRERAAERNILPAQGIFLNQTELPCLLRVNQVLVNARNLDPDTQLVENVAMLRQLASCMEDVLKSDSAMPASNVETELLGDYRKLLVV